jgi:hypothetical protein
MIFSQAAVEAALNVYRRVLPTRSGTMSNPVKFTRRAGTLSLVQPELEPP